LITISEFVFQIYLLPSALSDLTTPQLHWRTPEEEGKVYESQSVPGKPCLVQQSCVVTDINPDPIHNYANWCSYTATWLKHLFKKGCKQLTLLEILTMPGKQPFRGLGRYGANEVMSISG
jgi:hypothetical protein